MTAPENDRPQRDGAAEARDTIRALARIVQTMVDNDPDEPIADSGHRMLDLWRHDAKPILSDARVILAGFASGAERADPLAQRGGVTEAMVKAAEASFASRQTEGWVTNDIREALIAALAAGPLSDQPKGGDAPSPRKTQTNLAGAPFVFTYRNYRGEVAERRVRPISVRYGTTDWHPEPDWLLCAWDIDKNAEREFAMADILTARDGMMRAAEIADQLLGEFNRKADTGGSTYFVAWRNSGIGAKWVAAAIRAEAEREHKS